MADNGQKLTAALRNARLCQQAHDGAARHVEHLERQLRLARNNREHTARDLRAAEHTLEEAFTQRERPAPTPT